MRSVVSGPVGSQDSLINGISGRNQLIPLPDHNHLIFVFYFLTSFMKLSRSPFSYDLFVTFVVGSV